jgi:lipopolysaccharide transport system permease protein
MPHGAAACAPVRGSTSVPLEVVREAGTIWAPISAPMMLRTGHFYDFGFGASCKTNIFPHFPTLPVMPVTQDCPMQASVSSPRGESRVAKAARDVTEGVTNYPVWATFAWQDIRQRYKRSVLGPFWITLTMLVTIAGMGPLYGALFKIDLHTFVPYLALGIITWGLLSSLILDGCACFSAVDTVVRSVRLPLTLHVMRAMWRNFVMFGHNILAYVPIMLFLGIAPKWTWLMAIPGALLVMVAAFPASIILGIFCTRFRDMQPIVGSIVQLAFFLTPIIWKPEALGTRAWLISFNPLAVFMEIVRGPIYGAIPSPEIYLAAIGITVVLYLVAAPLFVRFRSRIAFWI